MKLRSRVALVGAALVCGCAATGVSQAGPPTQDMTAGAAVTVHGCLSRVNNAPWYRTVAPYEHADIARTSVFACARFLGAMHRPNVVHAGKHVGGFTTPFNLSTRRRGEMYLYGGGTGNANPPALHTFIAKLRAGTAKQIWRTYLSDARKNNELHLSGAVDVLADGDLVAISDHTLYRLNGDTGKIVAKNNMPTGTSKPRNSAFNGLDAFPGGTLIVKSMNRPKGCTKNGYPAAASPPPAGCPGAPDSAPPSILGAVNPRTLKVLDWVELPNNIPGRVTTAVFKGQRYVYLTGSHQVFRYTWDGKNLKRDSTWGPVTYTAPGQGVAGAAAVMNGWVVLSTNGNPRKTPLSVVAISQANSGKVLRIRPNRSLKKGQVSYYYAKVSVDPGNNRIYVMDAGLGTASAIHLGGGRLSLIWKVKELSNSYITLINPKNRRVFVETNIRPNRGVPVTKLNAGPKGANYTEQVQWRNAATGRLLAASKYYPPAAFAAQVPPGYGGYIYDILNNGHIVPLLVRPRR